MVALVCLPYVPMSACNRSQRGRGALLHSGETWRAASQLLPRGHTNGFHGDFSAAPWAHDICASRRSHGNFVWRRLRAPRVRGATQPLARTDRLP
eukprot:4082325-Prymnesium_polylepis.1